MQAHSRALTQRQV